MKNHENPPKAPEKIIGLGQEFEQSPDNVVEFPLDKLSQRIKSPFEADAVVLRTVFLPRFDIEAVHNRMAERALKTQRDRSWESIRQADLSFELDTQDDHAK